MNAESTSEFLKGRLSRITAGLVIAASALVTTEAAAEEPAAAAAAAPAPAEAQAPAQPAKPPPAPYSLPWMLRPVTAANVVRLDTTLAFAKTTTTVPIMVLGSYKVLPNLAAIVRLGVIHNEPKEGASATSFINPAIGALYSIPIGKTLKAGIFGAVTIPVGTGGGDGPDLPKRTADLAGIFARASMDNALFQINYMTPIIGAGLAYINDGITLQAEATVLELIRVRGADVDKDATRTNITAGLHFGWFLLPQLSFGTELRYQYWASHPTIQKDIDAGKPNADVKKDNWTLGFGPRAHIKLNDKMWLRPGVQLTMGLDLPTGFSAGGTEHKIVQVDIPFSF